MRKIIVLLLYATNLWAQSPYPQDYFRYPLDITPILSGTFAELRSNHFHSGIDLKTQQKTGLRVYSAAAGYVSRIKISHYGYGKALYITHPNGYTTVYAHLKKFSKAIESYIKTRQYTNETFEIEVFPKPSELPIHSGEVIGYSGNTGSSGGPHLHFEIRDNAERPINPMLFGITAKDSKKPTVTQLYAYTQNDTSVINGKNKRIPLRLIPTKNGNYKSENITGYGKIGFSVATHDKLDLAPNKNGVAHIASYYNGSQVFEMDFKRFSFYETRHINRFIDFELWKTKKIRSQHLFVKPNNPLSMFKNVVDNGYVTIEDSTASVYKIIIKDFKQNTTTVTIPITGAKQDKEELLKKAPHYNWHLIKHSETTTLNHGKASVTFYPNTVYDDILIDFKVRGDTIMLHKDVIPLQKNIAISYDISHYKEADKNKLFVARLVGYYKKPRYTYTKRVDNTLSALSKTLGTYSLCIDDTPPKITPINFSNKRWLSKYRYLKVKISDVLSGISKYRATVNGNFILMEYDHKTQLLTHDFNDNVITDTENHLKIIVTDNVGNSTTFEATFFRK